MKTCYIFICFQDYLNIWQKNIVCSDCFTEVVTNLNCCHRFGDVIFLDIILSTISVWLSCFDAVLLATFVFICLASGLVTKAIPVFWDQGGTFKTESFPLCSSLNDEINKVTHIFLKAQVASNKNAHKLRHHSWAQFFMLFHMVHSHSHSQFWQEFIIC